MTPTGSLCVEVLLIPSIKMTPRKEITKPTTCDLFGFRSREKNTVAANAKNGVDELSIPATVDGILSCAKI